MALSKLLRIPAVIGACGAACACASGVTMSWASSGGGTFTDGSNWSSGMAPGPSDRSLFVVDAAFTVSFPTSVTNERLQIRFGDVTFSMSGTTYELTLTAFPSVQLGIFGGDSAKLTISGGQVRTRDASLGVFTSSQGEVVLQGAAASWLTQSNLTIGDAGFGAMSVGGGAAASCLGSCVVGGQIGSYGNLVVTGAGSTFTCFGNLTVGPPGSEGATARDAVSPQGTASVSAGGSLVAQAININGLGLLTGGSVSGAVNNSGAVEPGPSVGRLAITGSFTQSPDGTTRVDIAGRTPAAEYDQIQVTGHATLAGTLAVAVATTFTPTPGDVFTLLTTTTGVTGSFGAVSITPPIQSGIPRVTVEGNNVVLRVLPRSANGDVDGNGVVNSVDLGLLLGAWGTSDPAADINGDGVVDSRDLAALLGGWGT